MIRMPETIFSLSEVAQLCPTFCDPVDCSLSGSSVHGIFQARVLEWIAISFSRGSARPRNRTRVSWIAGRRFTVLATREALKLYTYIIYMYNIHTICIYVWASPVAQWVKNLPEMHALQEPLV